MALLAFVFAAPQLYFAWRMCYRLRANSSATGFVGMPFKLMSLKHFTAVILSIDGHPEVTRYIGEDGHYAGSSSSHFRTYVLRTSSGQKRVGREEAPALVS